MAIAASIKPIILDNIADQCTPKNLYNWLENLKIIHTAIKANIAEISVIKTPSSLTSRIVEVIVPGPINKGVAIGTAARSSSTEGCFLVCMSNT